MSNDRLARLLPLTQGSWGGKVRLLACLLACAVALPLLAALVVCPKCGYEVEPAPACSHCQSALPDAPPPVPLPSAPVTPAAPAPAADGAGAEGTVASPGGGKGTVLPAAVVTEEVELGRKQLKEGNLEMARLYFLNAAALDQLTDPSQPRPQAEDIVALVERCDGGGQKVQRKCPTCGGRGTGIMRALHLKGDSRGDVELLEASGAKCVDCGGSGFVMEHGTCNDRRYVIGRSLNRFTQLQQARKYVAVGGAWVPRTAAPELNSAQRVQLQRATASPCAECAGIGRMDCAKCNGQGWIKCPNRDCVKGRVQTERKSELTRFTTKHSEPCPMCQGRTRVSCEPCQGKGSVLCEVCKGTGQRAICTKCAGQGLAPCRRCNGSGRYRDKACDTCGGAGTAVCTTCNGDGRKR